MLPDADGVVLADGVVTVTGVAGVITIGPGAVTGFFAVCASGSVGSAAPNAWAALANSSSAKSIVFLRHLARPRINLVFDLLSAYLSVIHSSAVYLSVSR